MTLNNNYLSDYSLQNTNPYSLFIHPYAEAISNLKGVRPKASMAAPANLTERVKQVLAGLALLIPVINALALLWLRKYCTTTIPAPVVIPNPLAERTVTPRNPQPVQQQLVVPQAPSQIHPQQRTHSVETQIERPKPHVVTPPAIPRPQQVQTIVVPPPAPLVQQTIPAHSATPAPAATVQAHVPTPQVQAALPKASTPVSPAVQKQQLKEYVEQVHSDVPSACPETLSMLTECGCISPATRKREVDTKILALAESIRKDQTLNYVSVGSGGMLQDWVNIAKLIEKGFTKLSIHFIDEAYSKDGTGGTYQWKDMKKQVEDSLRILGATQLQVNIHQKIENYLSNHFEPIDFLVAVDIPTLAGGILHELRALEPNLLARYEDDGHFDDVVSRTFALYMGGKSYSSQVYDCNDLARRVTGYPMYRIYERRNEDNVRIAQKSYLRRLPWLAFVRSLNNAKPFDRGPNVRPMEGFQQPAAA